MLANLNDQPLAEVETLLQSTRNRSKRKDDLGACLFQFILLLKFKLIKNAIIK